MAKKITDMEISCDAILDQEVNQEIGFLGEQERMDFFHYEEERDKLEREAFGVRECCNGTGQYWDCDPYRSKKVPCDDYNGTGFLKDQDESYN